MGFLALYDELFEAWKRELHSTELQPLRTGFFKDVASYARRLKEAQRNLDQKSLKAVVLEDELKRLQQLLRQLIDRRFGKARDAAGGREPTAVDTPERWVMEELAGISHHMARFKEDLDQGREPEHLPPKKQETLIVRFIKDLPAIMGVDLKTHGPFKTEDIATLPFENAESLIRQGVAQEIRPRPRENE